MGEPVKIDKESLDYIVGTISQKLETIEKAVQKQNGAVGNNQKALQDLPCKEHTESIKQLQGEWARFIKWDGKKKAAAFTFVLTLLAVFIKILLL